MQIVKKQTPTPRVLEPQARTVESLRETLADLERSLHSREELALTQAPDVLDAIQMASNRELAIEQLDRNTKSLLAVQDALVRIEAGAYGICKDCEEPIAQKRLVALPWATRCVSCQSKMDERESTSTEMDWSDAA